MPVYEYKVVPAPEKARKVKGLKGAARFSNTVETVMNELGQNGWRYVRTDTLPEEERSGLTGRKTTHRTMLVFMRETPDLKEENTALPDAQTLSRTAEAPAELKVLELGRAPDTKHEDPPLTR